jgi:hypothetical protein
MFTSFFQRFSAETLVNSDTYNNTEAANHPMMPAKDKFSVIFCQWEKPVICNRRGPLISTSCALHKTHRSSSMADETTK